MRISRTVAAVGALAAVAAVLAGCGSGGGGGDVHEGTDAHESINPLDPDTLDADETATTAMQAILSWQPAIDASKSDALRRARPWLGGELLATVQNDGAAPGVRPDREWTAWKNSGDALSALCVRDDSTPAAPKGMRTLVIDVTCTQTALHAAGSSTRLSPETWRTTVTRTDDGWRMTDYRYHQQ
ncbi:hypothetical protein [Rhodococcus sp. NPDC058481]|uniref:hypothetical protein n=1 Tax=unclassified Rhodococcus (in: high G+C Gram-positive bacteria) TaxID=192944 RepID=UPI00364ABAEE